MPFCFISCGVMFIFIICGIFNSTFFVSKHNLSITLLYITTQIFSFFIKDVSIFNVSIVYIIPIIYTVLIYIFNCKTIHLLRVLTLSLILATLLLAIGFIDTAFLNFIQHNFISICLIGALLSFLFSKNIFESISTVCFGYYIFIFGIITKESVTLNLNEITILNCITTTMLMVMFLQSIKNSVTYLVRRNNNEKLKKV